MTFKGSQFSLEQLGKPQWIVKDPGARSVGKLPLLGLEEPRNGEGLACSEERANTCGVLQPWFGNAASQLCSKTQPLFQKE